MVAVLLRSMTRAIIGIKLRLVLVHGILRKHRERAEPGRSQKPGTYTSRTQKPGDHNPGIMKPGTLSA
eukprot:1001448-Pleurochrysis_carterae.AAC.1